MCIRRGVQRTRWPFSANSATGQNMFRPSETRHAILFSLPYLIPSALFANEVNSYGVLRHSVGSLNVQPRFPYMNLLLHPTLELWDLTQKLGTDPDYITALSGSSIYAPLRHLHTRHSLEVTCVMDICIYTYMYICIYMYIHIYTYMYHLSQNFTFLATMLTQLLQLVEKLSI